VGGPDAVGVLVGLGHEGIDAQGDGCRAAGAAPVIPGDVAVEDAVGGRAEEVELLGASGDIADIDLYLYYYGAGGWEQRAVSGGADSNEYIYYTNPDDGTYFVGINNYSGPAGHFDLTRTIATKAGGIEITGLPGGPVPAYTPVTLTIHYDKEMEPGTYPGLVHVGPPEAPQLKEIPISITKLAPSVAIAKEVDQELVYPGNELHYTIDLFNLGGWTGDFSFVDPIPDHTTFVDAGICADELVFGEDFEGAWLPAGWAVYDMNENGDSWFQDNTRARDTYSAAMFWSLDTEEDWLVLPPYSVPASGATLSFWQNGNWTGDYVYHGLWVSAGSGDPDDGQFVDHKTLSPSPEDTWQQVEVDLSAYAGQTIYIAFVYEGYFADDWWIDDVSISQQVCYPVTYSPGPPAEISYVGPLPPGTAFTPAAAEGFEDGVMPPPGWEAEADIGPGWEIVDAATYPDWVHSGAYAALAYWDGNEDITLFSPWFTVDSAASEVSFWAYSATEYTGVPVDGQEVDLLVIDEDDAATLIWDMQADETWDDFAYRQVTASLAAFEGQNVRLAWHYYEGPWTGYKGVFALDDVAIDGTMLPIQEPSATIHLTVQVDDPVAGGTEILNTATLDYEHAMPAETESYSADALSLVATGPNLSTSYKVAPERVYNDGEIVYEIHIINTGQTLADVVVTDPIPAGTTYLWHDGELPYHLFVYNDVLNAMRWEGFVLPGEERVFTFGVLVDHWAPPLIENVATVGWGEQALPLQADTEVIFRFGLPMIFRDFDG